jgi:hypothetical protein
MEALRENGETFSQIIKKIQSAFTPSGRYFAKLSLRSAKDSLSLKKK